MWQSISKNTKIISTSLFLVLVILVLSSLNNESMLLNKNEATLLVKNHSLTNLVIREPYLYFEVDKEYELDLNIVNVGNKDAKNVEITVSTLHPYLTFQQNKIRIQNLKSSSAIENNNKIKLKFTKFVEEITNGTLFFEVKIDGVVVDTQKIIFFE